MCLSTGPQQEHGTFYEFRTYNIRPEQNAAFLKLTNEKIHLRTAHSQLIGYWSVEYGALNQVFHIWKYGETMLLLGKTYSSIVWTGSNSNPLSPLSLLRELCPEGGSPGGPGPGPVLDL